MKNVLFAVVFFLGALAANAQSSNTYNTFNETKEELEMLANLDGANVRYFYYPNLQAYYDRQTDSYLYTRNGRDWLEGKNLPNNLRGYSLSNGKRIPLSGYDGETPFDNLKQHMADYPADYKTRRKKNTPEDDGNMAMN